MSEELPLISPKRVKRQLTLLERRESNIQVNENFIKSLSLSRHNNNNNNNNNNDDPSQLAPSLMLSSTYPRNKRLEDEDKVMLSFTTPNLPFPFREEEYVQLIQFLRMDMNGISNSCLLYGDSGQGKTSLSQSAISVISPNHHIIVNCPQFVSSKDFFRYILAQFMLKLKEMKSSSSSSLLLDEVATTTTTATAAATVAATTTEINDGDFDMDNIIGEISNLKISSLQELICSFKSIFNKIPVKLLHYFIILFDSIDHVEKLSRGLSIKLLRISEVPEIRLKILATTLPTCSFSNIITHSIKLKNYSDNQIHHIISRKSRDYLQNNSEIKVKYNIETILTSMKDYLSIQMMRTRHIGFLWASIQSYLEHLTHNNHQTLSIPNHLHSNYHFKIRNWKESQDYLDNFTDMMKLVLLSGYISSRNSPDMDFDRLVSGRQSKRSKRSLDENIDMNTSSWKKEVQSYPFSLERLLSVFSILVETNQNCSSKSSSKGSKLISLDESEFYTHVTSLERFGFLIRHRSYSIANPIYLSSISYDLVVEISKKFPDLQGLIFNVSLL